jgi:hydroxylamine reductase
MQKENRQSKNEKRGCAMALNEEPIFGALVGLAGAVTQNGKTEATDAVVRRALTAAPGEAAEMQTLIAQIHAEKFRISPNCATCAQPCGNTSDYDMRRLDSAAADVKEHKRAILAELKALAARTVGALPDCVYRALCYLGYDLAAASYQELLEELKQC